MDKTDRHNASQSRPLRVAVVGNSNSVMQESFSRILANSPGIVVTNRSIGSIPNVLLLDFLALEPGLGFDFIVIDTAVCDFLFASKCSRARAFEIFELFVLSVQARSNAQIVLLTIPTRLSLIAPDQHWQQSIYQDVASRFGLPLLDGFELVRQLVGQSRISLVKRLGRQAQMLEKAFGLSGYIWEVMTWRNLRDNKMPLNALGVYGFNDHLHFSGALHALVGELLRQFLMRTPQLNDDRPTEAAPEHNLVVAAGPVGGKPVTRRNSMVSRSLCLISQNETVRYECPPGYRAYGILSNISVTSCFLRMTSPAGAETFDMHHLPQHMEWVAQIIPIVTDIGDGEVEVTPLDRTQVDPEPLSTAAPGSDPAVAELGELILVRTGWKAFLPATPEATAPPLHIEALPWAKPIIEQFAATTANVVHSIEAQGRFVDESCDRMATALLTKREAALSTADRARILLLFGKTEELQTLLIDSCADQPDQPELQEMLSALRSIQLEDAEGPEELLIRARGLVQEGKITEAEVVYEEGMARFTSEVRFWFEHASLAHNQKRDWQQARGRWQMMRQLFPKHPSWFRGLVVSMRECGCVEESERTLDGIVADFPDNADIAADHAILPLTRGDVTEALCRLRDVRQRFPDHQPNSTALIRLLAREGDYTNARRELLDFVDHGGTGHDVLRLAITLVEAEAQFDWLPLVWDRLASGVPDRARVAQEANTLFDRYAPTHDCSFLKPWMTYRDPEPARV